MKKVLDKNANPCYNVFTVKRKGLIKMKFAYDSILSDMSINELEKLSKDVLELLNQKRMQKKDEDWKKVVDTMQTFIKNWGAITIDCEYDDDILLDEDITFPCSGTIHPAFIL